MKLSKKQKAEIEAKYDVWRGDWCLFATEVLGVVLDPQQEEILRSVQTHPRTTVASGTARGKDFIAAVACLCFLYLTPRWNEKGELEHNTKIAMTAPSDRQVGNIMYPEITRLWNRAKILPGRLVGYDIRFEEKEWFLTGFKADDSKHEAWSGFHAVNTMFVVTEASGISESTFAAIEGNLQGNSRILIVFNPNIPTGYAADSQKQTRWKRFRLDSLNAPNVLQKEIVIPGQVDYDWVKDKVETWCEPIDPSNYSDDEGDFYWEGICYRPNDTFRVKVRGMFPKVGEDVLIPLIWIEAAQKRWQEHHERNRKIEWPLRLGIDVAGMGRDSSCFVERFGPYVAGFKLIQSQGEFNHTHVMGLAKAVLEKNTETFRGVIAQGFIDTIGEGAAMYPLLLEQAPKGSWTVHSCKFSEAAKDMAGNPLKDRTGLRTFLNMRAWSYWAIRDWLDPASNTGAMLPPTGIDRLIKQLTETKWQYMSSGMIKIEEKDQIKLRLKHSPDEADALANTFWPIPDRSINTISNAKKAANFLL